MSDLAVDLYDGLRPQAVDGGDDDSDSRRGGIQHVRVTAWAEAEAADWPGLPDALVDLLDSDRRRLIAALPAVAVVADGASLARLLTSQPGASTADTPLELACRWSHGGESADCSVPMATLRLAAERTVSVRLRLDCVCVLGVSQDDDEAFRHLDASLRDYARALGEAVARQRRPVDTNYHLVSPGAASDCRATRLLRVFYPAGSGADPSQLRQLRHGWHEQFGLAKTRPLFWPAMRLKFGGGSAADASGAAADASAEAEARLVVNPHLQAKPQPATSPWVTQTVQGDYAYYHYGSCGFHDSGWGCAYRSLQTLVSWLRRRGVTDAPVPSHAAIQRALVELGDKPKSLIGSRQWLGAVELSYALSRLTGVQARLLHVTRGSQLPEQARLMLHHFETLGAPVMIGGGQYAHTLLGCSLNEATGEVRWLVLDPHYTGTETDAKVLAKDGWCGWKPATFFKADVHYNLCIPQPEMGV